MAQQDLKALAELMNKNFDARRSMFGDAALGATNLKMISMAQSVGGKTLNLRTAPISVHDCAKLHAAAAKFTGSGGAIVVFCPQGDAQAQELQKVCNKEGFSMTQVQTGHANQDTDL